MTQEHSVSTPVSVYGRRRYKLSIVLTILLLIFSGCKNPVSDNNNRNSGNTDNQPQYGTDDSTGFMVVHADPKNGSTGESARNYEGVYAGVEQEVETQNGWDYININQYQIELVFNNRINMQTLSNALSLSTSMSSPFYMEEYFTLENHSVKINTSGYGMIIGETYKIHVDTSLQDIYGNRLDSPHTFSFQPEPHFRLVYVGISSPGFSFGQEESYLTKECPNKVKLLKVPLCISNLYAEFNGSLSETLASGTLIESSLNLKDSLDDGGLVITPSTSPMLCLEQDKEYSITLKTALSDDFGNKLRNPIQVQLQMDSFRALMSDAWWSGTTATYTFFFNGRIDSAIVAQNIRFTPPRDIEGFTFDAQRLSMEVSISCNADQFDNTSVQLLPFINPDGYMLADTVSW